MTPRLSRRELLRLAGGMLAGPLAACASGGGPGERLSLAAPPAPAGPWAPGLHPLGLGGERDGVVLVPARPGPWPLMMLLHGAGGAGRRVARLLAPAAESAGCLVVAPDSRARTWDAVTGDFGPDVVYLSRVLAMARGAVDAGRVALAGFSDGATYALALGRANGDRFTHLLAFSPGFLIPVHEHGAPPIFVSHGRGDTVLPIATCSRRLVPALRRRGYSVSYREFDGGHEVPPAVAGHAMSWLLGRI